MKIITTEVLINRQMEVPVITGIYDPLSKKDDGTITSQAPIIVSGKHLDMLDLRNIRLCLAPAVDYDKVIEVLHVYKYAHNQVIVSLPFLIPGEYFPAVKIMKKKCEDSVYIFPVSWVVMPEGHERGDYYLCCTDIAK
ncbi:DUF4469 domain-containing protein [Bacteroides sp.]|uniref:DUF4469 domain-containing protein n=1 Tax=Bacteroides sp. TaxID=29523 RepID=UPI0025BF743C|nr:DUF4469 domain-containing protein [Bacteroides sp.]